jgi:hypothetical protein
MMTFGLKAQGRESLDFVFDGSVDTDSKEAVNDITQRIFDNQLDLEVKDLLNQYQSAKKS